MNKKIPRFIILILIISFICVGCSDDTKNKTAKTDENVLHCKRKAILLYRDPGFLTNIAYWKEHPEPIAFIMMVTTLQKQFL